MTHKFTSTLQGRLTLALLLSFIVIGVLSAVIFIYSSREYQRQVTQVMHRELASHVVDNYLLFENGQPNLDQAKDTFHDLMILGPNFEFYLLDNEGNILSFSAKPSKVKRRSVDLAPIQHYLNTDKVGKPVFGDDPRGFNRKKIFTAAQIMHDEKTQGYMYVILGSEIYDEIADVVMNNKIIQWSLWIFIVGLTFTLCATLWVTRLITRPLTILTKHVRKVETSGFSKDPAKGQQIISDMQQWSERRDGDIQTLGVAFKKALEKIHEQYHNIITIDELRKELLSHVSHDLRTPLASLLGYLETWELNQENLSPEQSKKYVATAKKSAQRISSLVEQLFELAHLDSDNVQVNREPFSIAELVQDVLQKFQLAAENKNIRLHVTPQDASIIVMGDIEKLERVFTNLIENALRHSNNEGSITVRLNNDGKFVAIEVEDTGIGIPSEDLLHIFDPHYKAGNSVRENTAHGGLGLAITKRLLELHHSSIHVKSQIDKGTTFEFALQCV